MLKLAAHVTVLLALLMMSSKSASAATGGRELRLNAVASFCDSHLGAQKHVRMRGYFRRDVVRRRAVTSAFGALYASEKSSRRPNSQFVRLFATPQLRVDSGFTHGTVLVDGTLFCHRVASPFSVKGTLEVLHLRRLVSDWVC